MLQWEHTQQNKKIRIGMIRNLLRQAQSPQIPQLTPLNKLLATATKPHQTIQSMTNST